MAIYRIATVPDPVLTTPAKPVTAITDQVVRVLNNLAETLKAARGIGLAATQVSILKRLAVVDTGDGRGVLELINPELLEGKDMKVGWDACLSIPGLSGETLRYEWVKLRTMNRDGEWVELTADGLRARCIQHEMDHLDGVLFTDKAVRIFKNPPAQKTKQQPSILVPKPKGERS